MIALAKETIVTHSLDMTTSPNGVVFNPSDMKAALDSPSFSVPVFSSRKEKLKWMREQLEKAEGY